MSPLNIECEFGNEYHSGQIARYVATQSCVWHFFVILFHKSPMLNTDSHIRGSRCSVFLVPERVQAVKSLTLRHEPFTDVSMLCHAYLGCVLQSSGITRLEKCAWRQTRMVRHLDKCAGRRVTRSWKRAPFSYWDDKNCSIKHLTVKKPNSQFSKSAEG